MPDLKWYLPLEWPVGAIAGIAAIVIFCICTFTAVALYPRGTVRASIGCYTSPGDVEALVEQVRVLAARTGAD